MEAIEVTKREWSNVKVSQSETKLQTKEDQ